MKYCIYCGVELADDAVVCTSCGEKQPSLHFCCHCGAEIEEGDAFCSSCGKSLSDSEASTVATSSPLSEEGVVPSYKQSRNLVVGIVVGVILCMLMGGGLLLWNRNYNDEDLLLADSTITDSVVVDSMTEEVTMGDLELDAMGEPSLGHWTYFGGFSCVLPHGPLVDFYIKFGYKELTSNELVGEYKFSTTREEIAWGKIEVISAATNKLTFRTVTAGRYYPDGREDDEESLDTSSRITVTLSWEGDDRYFLELEDFSEYGAERYPMYYAEECDGEI